MALARPIAALVEIDGTLAARAVAEEPGVAIGQAEQGGDLRAVVGAAQDPDFGRGVALREGFHRREGMALARKEGQFFQSLSQWIKSNEPTGLPMKTIPDWFKPFVDAPDTTA